VAELLCSCYNKIFTSSVHVNQAKITLLVFSPGFIAVAYLHVSVVEIHMLRKYMMLHPPTVDNFCLTATPEEIILYSHITICLLVWSYSFLTATMRMAGSIEKSTDVMKAMQSLIRVSEIQQSMMELSREMSKVGTCVCVLCVTVCCVCV